ncbi:hypothetical protein [Pseudomonas fluorescens]|nr:hypothetical protein [Pseudomonas fluorescens]
MIDPYAPPTASLIPDPVSRAFFVVSKFKFALMYVLTCGFYLTYWLYMNWKLQRAIGSKVSPLARTVFGFFFVHSLFVRIDLRIKATERQFVWYPKSMATGVLVLIGANVALNWMNDLRLASVLGVLILIVETYCFMQVQDAINHAENDVDGLGNASLTWANGAWIGLGLCIWAFAFIAYYAIFTNAV